HFMKALIQSIPNPIFYKDTQGRYQGCNPAFEKLIGRTQKEILGRTAAEVFPKEQAEIFSVQDNDLLEKGGLQVYESKIGVDGRVRDVIFHKSFYYDSFGNTAGIIGSILDITEAKRAEVEIRKQAGLIGALINNVNDLIFYKDFNGVYLGCNDEFARHIGKDKNKIIGTTDYDHYSKEEADQFRKNDLIVLETGKTHHNEEWTHYPDGRKVYLDTFKSRFYDSDGNLIGTIGISRDITERKSNEILLKQSKKELEDALRSLDEAQTRMIEQEKLAAVGKLAGGVAHEFNNILAGIMGFTEMMQARMHKPDFIRQGLSAILSNSERGARLVKQILDFSRRSIGQRTQIDLIELVNKSVIFLRNTMPETISISSASQDMEALVQADKHQLENLMTNLALNACDAMPNGGELIISVEPFTNKSPIVLIPSKETLPEGKWILVTFKDTGKGIPPEIMSRIFEPFYTTKEVGEGSGMGLPQVYGIIRQHNGYIGIESVPEKGTCVRLYFPAKEISKADPNKFSNAGIAKGNGEELLLVEDDPTVRETSKLMLESINYRVSTAQNGREALAMIKDNPRRFKLIITDMVMPVMGGLHLAKKLIEENSELKLIAITGYPSENDNNEQVPANVAVTLQKPLRLQQLSNIIHQVLNKSG
ncbi:MAG TPA: PAS domain S-box protein, partial [Candidatus Marinimicrobia bacterium]|nr:PAS domain S-box protein [Candidatus Neomarinimicrobiota bacterium]